MTTLDNIHHYKNKPLTKDAVYIGRAGKGEDGYFGNPVNLIGKDRAGCLDGYRKYFYDRLERDPEFNRRINALKGKILLCFCYPKLCHGMIIIEYLDGISVEEQLKMATGRFESVFD